MSSNSVGKQKSLKDFGERIKVDLNECEIVENHYFDEVENYSNSKINALNYLSGDEIRNVRNVDIVYSVIIFRRINPITGKEEKFLSDLIPKDRITLSMFASKVQWATIYYSNDDSGNYYFDINELLSQLS